MYDYYRKKIMQAETGWKLNRIITDASRCTALSDYEYGALCVIAFEKMKRIQ